MALAAEALDVARATSRVLVLLSDGFGGHGGIAKFNRDLLGALCGAPQVRQVVALPRLAPEPVGPLPAKLTYLEDGLGGKLRYIAALTRLMVTEQFDLVVCAHINLLPFAAAAAARWNARSMLIVHGIDAWQPTGRALTDRLAARVDLCAAVSDFTRQRFVAWSGLEPARAHVLPNCVELDAFGPGPRSEQLLARYGLHGQKVLLTLARLSASERYKGIDEVLECLPALAREVPELAYVIAGDGDDRGRLEEKSRALGVAERVIFAGRIPEQEKADHYRLADAFVMPSRGEGFGIVFLEALACGVPVVASTLDASREAVAGSQLSVLADPGDPEQLQAAILRALSLPRGGVPASLARFSRAAYEGRVRELLASLGGP